MHRVIYVARNIMGETVMRKGNLLQSLCATFKTTARALLLKQYSLHNGRKNENLPLRSFWLLSDSSKMQTYPTHCHKFNHCYTS